MKMNIIKLITALFFCAAFGFYGCSEVSDALKDPYATDMEKFVKSTEHPGSLLPLDSENQWQYIRADSVSTVCLGQRTFNPSMNGIYSFVENVGDSTLPGFGIDKKAHDYLYVDNAFIGKADYETIYFADSASFAIGSVVNHDSLAAAKIPHGVWTINSKIEQKAAINKVNKFDMDGSVKFVQVVFTEYSYDPLGKECYDKYLYTFAPGYGLLAEIHSWNYSAGSIGNIIYALQTCKLK